MGAVDYLYKPIVPEVLRSKVAVFVDLCRKNAHPQKECAMRWSRRTPNSRSRLRNACGPKPMCARLNAELERRVEETDAGTVPNERRVAAIRLRGFA